MASEGDPRVLSGFLDYLKIEKGLAPLTVSAYATDIGQFSQFLLKQKRTPLNARRAEYHTRRERLIARVAPDGKGRSLSRASAAAAHLALGIWCEKNGLDAEAKAHGERRTPIEHISLV